MKALGGLLLLGGLALVAAFFGIGDTSPLGQWWNAAGGAVLVIVGLALVARPREGPYPASEVACVASSIVAASLAVATVIGAARGANARTLAVLAATGMAYVVLASVFALRASSREGARTALVAPGVALSALAGIFFVGALVLGGV